MNGCRRYTSAQQLNPFDLPLIKNYHPRPAEPLKGRGGAGRGQGRKPLSDADPTVVVSVKMTASQREKLARLGGPAWLRNKIDQAREPKE